MIKVLSKRVKLKFKVASACKLPVTIIYDISYIEGFI